MRRSGEGALESLGVGRQLPDVGNVAAELGVHELVAVKGALEVEHRRQRLVLDDDVARRVDGQVRRLGDDDGDRVADVVDSLDGERQVLGGLHVLGHRPRAGQGGAPRLTQVRSGEGGDDAGPRSGGGEVDRDNAAVGDGRADEGGVQRAGDGEVGDETGLAREQRGVLPAQPARAEHPPLPRLGGRRAARSRRGRVLDRGHCTPAVGSKAERAGGGERGLDDVVVARAAAQVALQALAHLGLGRARVLGEEGRQRHHHAGCAVAALQAVILAESLLDGVQLALVGHPLDRGDRRAVRLHGEHRAGLDRLPVDEHCARAARRRVAADVGAGEADHLAQIVHEQQARLHLVLVARAVDRNRDPHRPPFVGASAVAHRRAAPHPRRCLEVTTGRPPSQCP